MMRGQYAGEKTLMSFHVARFSLSIDGPVRLASFNERATGPDTVVKLKFFV